MAGSVMGSTPGAYRGGGGGEGGLRVLGVRGYTRRGGPRPAPPGKRPRGRGPPWGGGPGPPPPRGGGGGGPPPPRPPASARGGAARLGAGLVIRTAPGTGEQWATTAAPEDDAAAGSRHPGGRAVPPGGAGAPGAGRGPVRPGAGGSRAKS